MRSGAIFLVVLLFAGAVSATLTFKLDQVQADLTHGYQTYIVENTNPLSATAAKPTAEYTSPDLALKAGDIKNERWEILTKVTKTHDVWIPASKCSEVTEENGSTWQNCTEPGRFIQENYTVDEWKTMKATESFPEGKSYVRLYDEYPLMKISKGWGVNIDMIPTFEGTKYSQYAWWNASCNYRKEVNITSTVSGLTNYQVQLNLTLANTSGTDIRFTWLNGSTEQSIDFWREDGSWSGASGLVWVEVPTLNATTYVYYNCTGFSDASNVNNTFLFGDDFSSGTLDTAKWTNATSGTVVYTQTGGELTVNLTSTTNTHYGKITMNNNISENEWEARIRYTFLRSATGNVYLHITPNSPYEYSNGTMVARHDGTKYYREFPSTSVGSYNPSLPEMWILKYNYSSLNVINASMELNNGTIATRANYFQNTTQQNKFKLQVFSSGGGGPNTFTVDYVIVKKYSPTEPTYTVGNQEQASTAPVITFLSQAPADISSLNLIANTLNITYNVSSTNSTPILFYKTNSSTLDGLEMINGTRTTGWLNKTCTNTTALSTTVTTWRCQFDDNIYPYVTTLDYETSFENVAHDTKTLTNANAFLKTELLNVSNATTYNFLEVMWNASTGSGVGQIWLCNSSYSTGQVNGSANCVLFATQTAGSAFNHSHSANSAHMVYPFAINTTSGKIKTLYVTPTMYIILRGSTGTWYDYTVNTTTRNTTTEKSTNGGVTWTGQTYTLDSHLHQFDAADNFHYFLSVVPSGETWSAANATNSTLRTDLLNLSGLPPSQPSIVVPTANNYSTSNRLNITYLASASPNGYNITAYRIELLNSDLSVNSTIAANNYPNLTLQWDPFAISNGTYYVKITANDSENQQSASYSEAFDFTLDTTAPWITVNSPANNTWLTFWTSANATVNYTLFDNLNDTMHLNSSIYLNNTNAGSTDWAIPGEDYRTALNLTGSIPFDDFQVMLETTSPASLNCLQGDYGDIRIYWQNTTANESRPYYIESSNSTYLKLFVNATNKSGTHYAYCGNSTAANGWSLDSTYIFADTVEGNSINTTKWTVTGSGISAIAGVIYIGTWTTGILNLEANYSVPSTGYILEFQGQVLGGGPFEELLSWKGNNDSYIAYNGTGYPYKEQISVAGSIVNSTISSSTWYNYKVVHNGTFVWIYRDNVQIQNGTLAVTDWIFGDEESHTYFYEKVDDVVVRHYAATEPTYALGATSAYVAANTISAVTRTGQNSSANFQDSVGTLVVGHNYLKANITDDRNSNQTIVDLYVCDIDFGAFSDSAYIKSGGVQTIYAPITLTGVSGMIEMTEVNATLNLLNGSNETLVGTMDSGSDYGAAIWKFNWTGTAGSGQINYTITATTNVTACTRTSGADNFTLDNTGPALNCTYNETNFFTPATVLLTCDASDGGAGLSSVTALVDGVSYPLALQSGSTYNVSIYFDGDTYGNLTANVTATDAGSNTNTTANQILTTSNITITQTVLDMTGINQTLAFPGNYSFNVTSNSTHLVQFRGTATLLNYSYVFTFPEGNALDISANETFANTTANLTIDIIDVSGYQNASYDIAYTSTGWMLNSSSSATVRYVNVTRPGTGSLPSGMYHLNLSMASAETWTSATEYIRIRTYDSDDAQWVNLNLCPSGGDSSIRGVWDYWGYDSDNDSAYDTVNVSLDLGYSSFILEFEKQTGSSGSCGGGGTTPSGDPAGGGGTTLIEEDLSVEQVPTVVQAQASALLQKLDEFFKGATTIPGLGKTLNNAFLSVLALLLVFGVRRVDSDGRLGGSDVLLILGMVAIALPYRTILLGGLA